MENKIFNRLTENTELQPRAIYKLPALIDGKKPTHIGFKNGKAAVFNSPNCDKDYKSSRNWTFKKIPKEAKSCLLKAERRINGWQYQIDWIF